MAQESAREREVHRFYQPWLETFHATNPPNTIETNLKSPREDGHTPQSSKDRSLTAFAQLGALKLNAKRGVVTLIDTKNQYVLAEATQSLSLLDDTRYAPGDELWLGNARLPRWQGVSEDAMDPPEYVAKDPGGEEYSARALVVGDIAVHPRYKDRKYANAGINFYAGVPIVTPRGYTIGVYNITDNKSRHGIKVEELRFMADMAAIVVQHLDTIRNERARARGERLIQGIGSFIEGDPIEASLAMESPGPNLIADPLDAAGKGHAARPPIKSRNSSGTFKGLTIQDANSMAREQYSSQEQSPQEAAAAHRKILPPVQKDAHKPSEKAKSQHALVFDRAAKIMRKCLGADGVAFLDASSANLSKGTARRENLQSQNSVVQHSSNKIPKHDPSEVKSQSAITPEDDLPEGTVGVASGIDRPSEPPREQWQLCELIASTVRDVNSEPSLEITEHDLRKLVRRHPQGNCYSFDENGKPASSDDSASESGIHPDEHESSNGPEPSGPKRKEIKRNALVAALPKARTIVFLPLWDFASQRWKAAGVMWSSNPAKLMNVNQDFSYLRAFANSVMNEIARLNLSVSDTAKATFLANISHELRSPLHGILGSIEFLHDTALDDFQSSMVISVETCGKTLLDTVNHVLDFAKLNNLSRKDNRNKSSRGHGNSHRPLTSTFDLATVVEEAVEAVYAGQVFRTANQDAFEGQGPALSSSDKAMMSRRQHKDLIALGQAVHSDAVRLTVNIDDGVNWHVSSQPGAVRRIVMNLLGNSLKYTDKGSINVSLETDTSRSNDTDDGLLHACIMVTDTGKGMSDDFVRNHAFTAFSQEDSLATGTGLGLSIIRSIVDSLGGKIDLRSQKDLGTEVKIWLSLPRADDPDLNDGEGSVLHQMAEKTSGMALCLLKPPIHENDEEKIYNEETRSALRDMPTVEGSLQYLLDQWFHLNVFTAPNMDNIRKADFFVYAEPPSIEYLLHKHGEHSSEREVPVIILCQNAFQANSLRASGIHQLTEIGRIVEIIAQPVGPQKLGKVLQRCMQRTRMLERPTELPSNEHVPLSVHRDSPVHSYDDGIHASNGDIASPAPNFLSTVADPRSSDKEMEMNEQHRSLSDIQDQLLELSLRPAISPRQPSQPSVDASLPPVLVVDDNQINLQLMVTFVRKTRHAYESACDGYQALEAYKRSATDPATGQPSGSAPKRFRCILMDVQMPKMDGSTATREIRKWEKEHAVEPPAKIFALTGLGEIGSHDWAQEAGFDRLLCKPIKFRELKELLI